MSSIRQEIHSQPGITLLATRCTRLGPRGRRMREVIDLLRSHAPGKCETFIKVAFQRGEVAEYELFFTEAEARACFGFPVCTAPLDGLAIPALLDRQPARGLPAGQG